MRRLTTLLVAVVAIAAVAALTAGPASARPRAFNGKIVTNSDNLVTGEEQVYTVDPDGTEEQLIYNNSEVGQWSPDGTRVVLVTQLGPPQLLLFNVDDGSSVYFGLPFDRYPDLALFCTVCTFGCFNPVWSPDGQKIALGRNQADDQRDLYTVNADGSGLFQVTHTDDISEFNGDWGTHPLTP